MDSAVGLPLPYLPDTLQTSAAMSKSDSSVDEKSIQSVGVAEAAIPGYIIDPEAEKRLLRKLDWRLLPLATAISKS